MKVIDLLNKIANGEKTPDRFIYDGMLFERYLDNYYQYYDRKNTMSNIIQFSEEICSDYSNLNDEIEIPEDTPKNKKIEDIARFQYSQIPSWFDIKELIKAVNENFEKHQKALYEIIDKINEGSENNETN